MSEHRCDEFVERVTAYLEGTLSAEARAEIEAGLAMCDGCSRYLDQVRGTVVALSDLRADSLPADVRAAILRALGHRRPDPRAT